MSSCPDTRYHERFPMIALPLFAGLMCTCAIALSRVMHLRPDPAHLTPKPLNKVLLGVMGRAAAIVTAVQSAYIYGLVLPAVAAAAFYALYRLILTLELFPFYKYALPIGVLTLVIHRSIA